MGLAGKFKRLAGIVPGISGYQDGEASRDTDKSVRLKLSEGIQRLKLKIEKEKRRCMDEGALSILPALDRVASKMDKTANLIKYAGRGYSGIFDIHRVDQDRLDKVYSFDLALFDDIDALKDSLRALHDAPSESSSLEAEVRKVDEAIEEFEKKFSARSDLLTSR